MIKDNIPVYRAKEIDSDKWVEGHITTEFHEKHIKYFMKIPTKINEWGGYKKVDPKTLSIHFPNMIDKSGKKIFASLGDDGIGGDIVTGMCRDCNGDALQMLHAPVPFKGLVRLYNETVMGVVVETEEEIIIPCDTCRPLVARRGEALRWSDCRYQIEVVGIRTEAKDG